MSWVFSKISGTLTNSEILCGYFTSFFLRVLGQAVYLSFLLLISRNTEALLYTPKEWFCFSLNDS